MKDSRRTIGHIFQDRANINGEAPLFLYHGDKGPTVAHYEGTLGIMTWSEAAAAVRKAGIGLLALGAKKGDCISIMSSTRPEWVIADLAVLSIGAQTGSIYPNDTAAQAFYIVNELESRFVFVEGEKMRDAFLEHKHTVPHVEKVVAVGCGAGGDEFCISFQGLMALGAENVRRLSPSFEDALNSIKLSDVASYIYTSGTTGTPKGAVHTHESLTYTVCTCASWMPISPGWTDLSFLPMSHIFEQFAGPFADIYRGDVKIAFARDVQTVIEDFLVFKPHYTRSPPRLLEKIHSAIWNKIDTFNGLRTQGFQAALEMALKVRVVGELEGQETSRFDREKLKKFDAEYFRRVRDAFLGGNLRFIVAGGAPLSKQLNEFFWSIGVPVYELYGMSEAGGVTCNRPGNVRLGTVGKSWPGQEWPDGGGDAKLSPEGEIMVKGPSVMLRYHNKPVETGEALREGWMRSGDLAEIDKDGFFRITGRIKDILITAGGKNVSPARIERVLEEPPLISRALVYGEGRKYLTALITLDEVEVHNLAKRLSLKGSYDDIAVHPLIKEEVSKIVRQQNQNLARVETIRDFVILDHDFSIEAEELTPTMKVKREKIFKKYGALMDELYEER